MKQVTKHHHLITSCCQWILIQVPIVTDILVIGKQTPEHRLLSKVTDLLQGNKQLVTSCQWYHDC